MSTSIKLFIEHIKLIHSEGYEIVDRIQKDYGQISISFDDGFRGVFENFYFFKNKNIPITIFLVTDYLGTKNYLQIREVKQLLETGLVTIGSHTVSHSNLTEISHEKAKNEMSLSKDFLEKNLNITIESFCFPRGLHSDALIEAAYIAGYKRVFNCIPGKAKRHDFVQNRYLAQHSSKFELKSILKGGMDIFANHYLKLHKT